MNHFIFLSLVRLQPGCSFPLYITCKPVSSSIWIQNMHLQCKNIPASYTVEMVETRGDQNQTWVRQNNIVSPAFCRIWIHSPLVWMVSVLFFLHSQNSIYGYHSRGLGVAQYIVVFLSLYFVLIAYLLKNTKYEEYKNMLSHTKTCWSIPIKAMLQQCKKNSFWLLSCPQTS